jgi:hypothetical protein
MFGKPERGSERINVLALHEHVGKEAIGRDDLCSSESVDQKRNSTRAAVGGTRKRTSITAALWVSLPAKRAVR